MERRELPSDLAAVLRRARQVELAATSRPQLLEAVRASTVLVAAARREGWRVSELAPGLGIDVKALHQRLRNHAGDARRVKGLVVTPALPRRHAAPLPPLEQREWLTRSEAAAVTGVSASSIAQWRAAGLLPSTLPAERGSRRYARSDIDRVLAAVERDPRGVRWAALRARLWEEALETASVGSGSSGIARHEDQL